MTTGIGATVRMAPYGILIIEGLCLATEVLVGLYSGYEYLMGTIAAGMLDEQVRQAQVRQFMELEQGRMLAMNAAGVALALKTWEDCCNELVAYTREMEECMTNLANGPPPSVPDPDEWWKRMREWQEQIQKSIDHVLKQMGPALFRRFGKYPGGGEGPMGPAVGN